MYSYVDAHIHLYKFSEDDLKRLLRNKEFIFLSISEDFSSSLYNLKLAMLYENIIPAVGIHPWNAHKVTKDELESLQKIINNTNIKVLGEIGLDKKFTPNTFDQQLRVFKFLLEIAKEYDLSVNLHSPNAWQEVLELLIKYDIKNAYFHWYTGPIDLLHAIEEYGYFVGINVAYFYQEKMKKIAEIASLKNVLTESDAPYKYKNYTLNPYMISELIEVLSNIKKVKKEDIIKTIKENLSRYLS